MKHITLTNADTNEVLMEFDTRKTKEGSIQEEILARGKEKFKVSRFWIQGSFSHWNGNSLRLGGNIWWVIPGVCQRAQYTIE